ncbi:MAG: TonB-dependent receptor [Lysobacterales bacterium]
MRLFPVTTFLTVLVLLSTQAVVAAEQTEEVVLEEIIVQANKRPTLLQDVALAVSAYTGESLIDIGVFEVADLPRVSPGVIINSLGNTTQTIVRIRGVGTDGVNLGFESSVGMFIDGVFRPRAGQALQDFVDIDRVEVLRGPQGTLFGKNTSAGVISIFSNRPEYEFGGEASLALGDYNLKRVTAVLTGPISEDRLAFRLAVNSHQRDGTLDKLGPGANPTTRKNDFYNDRDRFSVKGQLLFEPNDQVSARLILDYSSLDEVGNVSMPLIMGPVSQLGVASGLLGIPPGTPGSSQGLNDLGAFLQPDDQLDDRQTQNNTDPYEKLDDMGLTLEIEVGLGWGDLISITGLRSYESDRANDLDLVGADILQPNLETTDIDVLTEELRLSGTNGALDWLVGLYLYDEQIDFTADIRFGSQFSEFFGGGLPPGAFTGQGSNQFGSQKSQGFALFTHNIYRISEQMELTAGLRYSNDSKSAVSTINGATPGTPSVDDPVCDFLPFITAVCDNRSIDESRDEDEFSGIFGARYIWSDDVSVYANYSRGYKAGGINLDRESISDPGGIVIDNSQFGSETVDSYEVGLRSTIFGGRSTANLTAFYSDFKDFQLNSFNGFAFVVISIPKAVSSGIELETSTLLTSDLQLDLAASYIDARFGDDLGDETLTEFEGQPLPESPLWQVVAALRGQSLIGDSLYLLHYNLNYSYRSSTISGSQPHPDQRTPGYSLVGASVGVRSPSDRYGLMLTGTNLTDKIVAPFISPTILQQGSFSAYINNPRMLALTLDVRF